jgi:hypothetical protein
MEHQDAANKAAFEKAQASERICANVRGQDRKRSSPPGTPDAAQ